MEDTNPTTNPIPARTLIPIHRIHSEDRVRKSYNNIHKLAEDITNRGGFPNGLINAITVAPHPTKGGDYILIAGGRRYRALLLLGWTEAPCFVRTDTSELLRRELELSENLYREDIDPQERIENLRLIHELKVKLHLSNPASTDRKWKLEDTAALLNKDPGNISKEIKHAETLRARPDLKEKLKHLPLSRQMAEVKKIQNVERVERGIKSNEIKITNNFTCSDALTFLSTLGDNCAQCVLIDPPFGLDTLTDLEGHGSEVSSFTGVMEPDDNSSSSDVRLLMHSCIAEYFRVLKPGGHLYIFHASQHWSFLAEECQAVGFDIQEYPIVWNKLRGTSRPTGYNYISCYEPILFAQKPPRRLLNGNPLSILDCKPVPVAERVHIFEKPVELLSKLIEHSTSIGDVVLDTFAGSGSVQRACLHTKRAFLGCEKNPKHFAAAQGKLLLEASVK